MIRTLIEVTAETEWDFERNLKAALDKLGFEPKESAEHTRFMGDLWQALEARDIVPHKIVEELRAARERKAAET